MFSADSVKRAVWVVLVALVVPGGGVLMLGALLANRAWRAWSAEFGSQEAQRA